MGGNQSSSSTAASAALLKPKSIFHILDYIATKYILTLNFKSLRKLYDKEYCNNLVILTSDILDQSFTPLELTYLAQRVKNGAEVNELAHEKVVYFDRRALDQMDVQNAVKKKRLCNSIAKFYIKIAHLFAAIMTTINPVYVYKDAAGNTVRATYRDKQKIPPNTPRTIYKMNLCDKRIHQLRNGHALEEDADKNMTVGPQMCDVNVSADGERVKQLGKEAGIPELETLYFDADYNVDTGKFMGMSEETRKMYNDDLRRFYHVFSGKDTLPPNVKRFGDIDMRDYKRLDNCQGSNPMFGRPVKGSGQLFEAYANNVRQMIQTTNHNQEALLTVINKLFVYVTNPQTQKREIRINPSLTEDSLQQVVKETRALIIRLYLTCEMNYVEGLKIYEAIVEQQILKTTQKQIRTLEQMSDHLTMQKNIPQLRQATAPSSDVLNKNGVVEQVLEKIEPGMTKHN